MLQSNFLLITLFYPSVPKLQVFWQPSESGEVSSTYSEFQPRNWAWILNVTQDSTLSLKCICFCNFSLDSSLLNFLLSKSWLNISTYGFIRALSSLQQTGRNYFIQMDSLRTPARVELDRLNRFNKLERTKLKMMSMRKIVQYHRFKKGVYIFIPNIRV